jgi:cbb3-type cytochrome oxidase maturation protein
MVGHQLDPGQFVGSGHRHVGELVHRGAERAAGPGEGKRMESLTLLVPLAVALVFLIGWVFWRALEGGQFDDLERPAHDVLMDDDR